MWTIKTKRTSISLVCTGCSLETLDLKYCFLSFCCSPSAMLINAYNGYNAIQDTMQYIHCNTYAAIHNIQYIQCNAHDAIHTVQ